MYLFGDSDKEQRLTIDENSEYVPRYPKYGDTCHIVFKTYGLLYFMYNGSKWIELEDTGAN